MSLITSGANSVSGDALNLILCGFVADRECTCVCKRWYETMQNHFSLLAANHLLSGTLIKPFMARALSPRLTLDGFQNQGKAAILEDTASLVFKILRIESSSVTIDQIMCLSTPNVERLIQSNKDKNLVSFYNILKPKIADSAGVVVPDFTEAGEIRDWMRDNSVLLAQVQFLHVFDQIITEIPKEINFLTGLTYLALSHTQIAALPDGLNLPELEFLDLSHTRLATWPYRLNAPKLRSLDLRHTRVATYPNRLNFPALSDLQLNHIQISALPSMSDLFALAALRLRDAIVKRLAW